MCDYSLMSVPNRLARDGEDLVVYRFQTGAMGLASPLDFKSKEDPQPARRRKLWSILSAILLPAESESVPAVCIPPGASLLLMDIPEALQEEARVGRIEQVTFTQVTAATNSYRDAVRFRNGREILLQRLLEGQRLRVLALTPESTEDVGVLTHHLSRPN